MSKQALCRLKKIMGPELNPEERNTGKHEEDPLSKTIENWFCISAASLCLLQATASQLFRLSVDVFVH